MLNYINIYVTVCKGKNGRTGGGNAEPCRQMKNVTSINFNISQELKAMMEPPVNRREGKGGGMENGGKGRDGEAIERIWMKALVYAVEHGYRLEGDPVAEEMCSRFFKDPQSEKAGERFRREAYYGTAAESRR